jgi:hypothetical protein
MIPDETRLFLKTLFTDPAREVHLRGLPAKDEARTDIVPWKRNLPLQELLSDPTVEDFLRRSNERMGNYVVINTGGDKDHEIHTFNALFIENDELTIAQQHKLLDAAPLPPSIRVETLKSVHAYWLPFGPPLMRLDWVSMHLRLIHHFRSDPSIKNPSRVMRLPGFDHLRVEKGQYIRHPVRLVFIDPKLRYSLAELREAFPPVSDEGEAVASSRKEGKTKPKGASGEKVKEGGRNNTLASIAGSMHHRGLSPEAIEAALKQENAARCEPPLPDREVEGIVKSITKYEREDTGPAPLRPLTVVPLDKVRAEKVDWFWYPMIPFGAVTMVDGEEGIGKSSVIFALAVAGALGKRLRSGDEGIELIAAAEPLKVMVLSSEESISHVMKPRLLGLGAPLEQFVAVEEAFSFDREGLRRLELAVAEHEPGIVIVDPLFSYAGRVNLNSDNEVRSVMDRLGGIARKFGCAIICIRHVGKSKGMGVARAAGLAGIGFLATSRSALLIGQDPDTGARAIVQYKNNLAAVDRRAWGFEIEETEVENEDGELIKVGRVVWTGESSVTVGRMLAQKGDPQKAEEESDAVSFLRVVLQDGEKLASDVKEQAKAFGISEKQLRTARLKLGIKSGTDAIRREGAGENLKYYYRLPGMAAHTDEEGGHE